MASGRVPNVTKSVRMIRLYPTGLVETSVAVWVPAQQPAGARVWPPLTAWARISSASHILIPPSAECRI